MEEDLKKLLEENLRLTREVRESAERMDRFIFWQKVFGVLKLIIILVPLILALIYLPPFINEMLGQYREMLNITGSGSINLDNISPEILQNLLK